MGLREREERRHACVKRKRQSCPSDYERKEGREPGTVRGRQNFDKKDVKIEADEMRSVICGQSNRMNTRNSLRSLYVVFRRLLSIRHPGRCAVLAAGQSHGVRRRRLLAHRLVHFHVDARRRRHFFGRLIAPTTPTTSSEAPSAAHHWRRDNRRGDGRGARSASAVESTAATTAHSTPVVLVLTRVPITSTSAAAKVVATASAKRRLFQ
jgi:hypothetical protein